MSDHERCHRAIDEAKREAKYLRRYLDCGHEGPCAGPMAGDTECSKHALAKAERERDEARAEVERSNERIARDAKSLDHAARARERLTLERNIARRERYAATAERDTLRASLAVAERERDNWRFHAESQREKSDAARAEVESLRAELARLRAWATGERPGEGAL